MSYEKENQTTSPEVVKEFPVCVCVCLVCICVWERKCVCHCFSSISLSFCQSHGSYLSFIFSICASGLWSRKRRVHIQYWTSALGASLWKCTPTHTHCWPGVCGCDAVKSMHNQLFLSAWHEATPQTLWLLGRHTHAQTNTSLSTSIL